MIELIKEPWPWYVAGPAIAIIMFLLIYFGNNFGMSANLRTMCSMAGAGKAADFFDFNWKAQRWNLVFVVGTIVGGFVAAQYLTESDDIALSADTSAALEGTGFTDPGAQYLPPEIFSVENLTSLSGLLILILGGFLVGFGARYAGGCTSGHAISGLSDLQVPSLIAVIGFFVGGLAMTWLFIPLLF